MPAKKESAKHKAHKYQAEAKERLNKLMKTPIGFGNTSVDEFVDCIILAAVFEIKSIIEEKEKEKRQNEDQENNKSK